MAVVEAAGLTHRYGSHTALRDLDFVVPEGSLYALLGPNGSGKTTLLQILMGLRRQTLGKVSLLGLDSSALTLIERAKIGYIAEGQALPAWMRLEQVEAYLAPLYPTWDRALANDLRQRFHLDPRRKIKTFSRGEQMKAALLCALAPRPRLLIMDEPFTGMDALVKDELVRGLLDTSGSEGWTVLVASHDIGELELLADWVGFLAGGRMKVSEPMESLKQRVKRVDISTDEARQGTSLGDNVHVIAIDYSDRHITALIDHAGPQALEPVIRARFPHATRIDVREASLREIFVALAKQSATDRGIAA